MVDAPSTALGPPTVGSPDGGGPPVAGPKDQAGRTLRWIAAMLLGVTVAATGALTLGRSGAAAPAPAAGAHPVHLERSPHTVAPPLPTTTTTTGPTTIAPVTTPDTEPP